MPEVDQELAIWHCSTLFRSGENQASRSGTFRFLRGVASALTGTLESAEELGVRAGLGK